MRKRLKDMTALEMAAELSPAELRRLAKTGGAPLDENVHNTPGLLRGLNPRDPVDEEAVEHGVESLAAQAERDAEIRKDER